MSTPATHSVNRLIMHLPMVTKLLVGGKVGKKLNHFSNHGKKLSWYIIARSNFVKTFMSYYKYIFLFIKGIFLFIKGIWRQEISVPIWTFLPTLLHSAFLSTMSRSHRYLPSSVNPSNSSRKTTRSSLTLLCLTGLCQSQSVFPS